MRWRVWLEKELLTRVHQCNTCMSCLHFEMGARDEMGGGGGWKWSDEVRVGGRVSVTTHYTCSLPVHSY